MSTERAAEGDSKSHGSENAPAQEHPYQGEVLGGAAATVCPGFDPDPVRTCCTSRRCESCSFSASLSRCSPRGASPRATPARIPGGWWPGFLALPFYGLGVLLSLIDLIVVAMMAMGYNATAKYFKNALLTPGVVVSEKPLAVVILGHWATERGRITTDFSG